MNVVDCPAENNNNKTLLSSTEFVLLDGENEAEVKSAMALFCQYLKNNFSVYLVFGSDSNKYNGDEGLKEFRHWFVPQKGVVKTLIRKGQKEHEVVTDLCSYFYISSTVSGNERYKELFGAYSFYNIFQTLSIGDLLSVAIKNAEMDGCDIFSLLNIMDNGKALSQHTAGLHLERGGYLYYNFFNLNCPPVPSSKIGITML